MRKPSTTALRRRIRLPDGQLTIGLDLGDRSSFYCVLNGAGEVILEERVATNPDAMKKTFERMPASRIALETGTHSPWVSRLLAELALGPGQSWTLWVHGGEPAFTLVHNFLLTGMLAAAMGILLSVWSVAFIGRRGGATVFLLVSIASFLTGGGLAQVLLFTLNWATATRIHAPLRIWQRILPAPLRTVLARIWSLALISAAILFLAALEIATIGYFPGLPHDTDGLTRILWRLAAAIIAAVVLAIVAGFAHDLEVGEMSSRFPRPSSRQTAVRHG